MNTLRNNLIIFLFIGFFVLGITLIFVISFAWFHESTDRELYQYSDFNPLTNNSISGYLKLNRKLLKGIEYFSFENSNNHFITISGISEELVKTFECSSTCFCENDNRRSVGSLTLGRGLFFVVSAISTTLAVKYAGEYFLKACKKKFVDECLDKRDIKTDPAFCWYRELEADIEAKKAMKRDYKTRLYMCEGYCIPDPAIVRRPEALKFQKEYECEKKQLSHAVTIEEDWEMFETEEMFGVPVDLTCTAKARIEFRYRHLEQWCRSTSEEKVIFSHLYPEVSVERHDVTWYIKMCIGYSKEYENIECYMVDDKQ